MNRLSRKKPKKSPKPSPTHIFLGITTNIAAGPLGFRAELDIGPDGLDRRSNRGSRIIFQDNSGEDKRLPSLAVSTSGVTIVGTEHRDGPTRENTADTGEGEGGGKLANVSKVLEREYENTALTTTTIFSVPKEATDEPSPLGPLKAVLRTTAAVYANHQENIAIGNKIQVLLSRMVALEKRFNSRPDDVEELRRRAKLLRYAVITPSNSVLSSFQRVRSC
ncbi:hypothetical protein BDM02DRAFT_395232 [Thelephora ganbajun]|uniref:Uncharacterized protein n=1 Tax=Thelephora ganbajun TaxID=370292 RepID=A0ACB6Z8T7_THEGA|nr:hypothetical protein BDM02DRAFT_395232 [Thelephora ganbajun]